MKKSTFLYELLFPNGKRYIGVSECPEKRWRAHYNMAKRGSMLPIYKAIRHYGFDNIVKKVLVEGSKEYIYELEASAIKLFNSFGVDGYNASIGGETSPVAVVGHTEESKKKMSDSQKLRKHTPEEIAKMTASLKGRVFSQEHIEKLRKPKTEEHKKNMSKSAKAAGRKYPSNKGIPHSDQTKAKIKEKRALQVITNEAKKRMSEAQTKRWARIRLQKAEPVIPDEV